MATTKGHQCVKEQKESELPLLCVCNLNGASTVNTILMNEELLQSTFTADLADFFAKTSGIEEHLSAKKSIHTVTTTLEIKLA